jgi:hypothetical protein
VIEILEAEGPDPAHAGALLLYGRLVGAWDVDVVDHGAGGTFTRRRGEWHFGWVLEGRAIQDVFVVPRRDERTRETPLDGNRCGTTLRVYDPVAGHWHTTWINPVRRVRTLLVGRQVGEEIVQEGRDDDGTLNRWVFSEITSRSFRWRGEVSTDGGSTWKLIVTFEATRR